MKRSIWLAYIVAPLSGPLLYGIIVLFIPDFTNKKEFSAVAWIVSLTFFTGISYIAWLIFGSSLIFILKKINKLTFWWVVVPGTVLYAVALYLLLFAIMGVEIIDNKKIAIGSILFVGVGLGIIVSTLFCFLARIIRRPGP